MFVSFFHIIVSVQDCGEEIQETAQEPSFQKGLGKVSAFSKGLFLLCIPSAVACQLPPARWPGAWPMICSQSKVTFWFTLVLFNL